MNQAQKIVKTKIGLLRLAETALHLAASRSGNLRQAAESLVGKVAQEGLILTEDQLRALEKAREEKQAHVIVMSIS